MAAATPGVSEMVGILVMLLGGGFGFPLGVPPEKEDPVLARVAPEECVFYTSWAGIADPDPQSGNRTEQLLAEPEVQQLISTLDAQLRQTLGTVAASQRDPQSRTVIEVGPKLLRTLVTRPTAIFLSSVRVAPAGLDVKGGMLVNLGEAADDVMADLQRLLSGIIGDAAETVEIGGSQFRRVQLDPRFPVITWGSHGAHLVVGVGDRAVEGILERMETEPPNWLVKLGEQLPVERRSTISYLGVADLMNTFVPLAGPQAQQVVAALGLENVSAFGSVSGLDKSGFVKRTWLGIDGEPRGAFSGLLAPPLSAEDLRPIPHDTPLAVAFRLDLGRLLGTVLAAVGQIDGRTHEQMSQALRQIEAGLGFELREGLLKALGDVWTVHAAPHDGGLLTGWTVTIQVRDRQRLGEILQRLVGLAAGMRAHNPRAPQIRTLQMADQTVHYLVVPGQAFPISPAWCLTDTHLVIALFPHTVKGFLGRGEDVKSLAELPSVAGFLAEGNGPLAVTYVDSRKLFRIAYPFLQIGLNVALQQASRQGLAMDAAILPSASSIEKHLTPSVAAMRRTETGVEWIRHQTLPGGNLGASAPVAIALLLPAVQSARDAARRTSSRNNLKMMGLAMHNFHDVYSRFPAAYSADEQGKPLLSWRVHILPFLEQQELYKEFHLDEPWDSEHNKRLIARMPVIYRSPLSSSEPGKTVYLGNQDKQGVFIPPGQDEPRNLGTGIRDIVDGTSNTIMIVEATDDKAVIWTKPGDFEPNDNDPASGLANPRFRGFQALFCDGSVRFISENIDRETLRLLFMKNDGKPINNDEF